LVVRTHKAKTELVGVSFLFQAAFYVLVIKADFALSFSFRTFRHPPQFSGLHSLQTPRVALFRNHWL